MPSRRIPVSVQFQYSTISIDATTGTALIDVQRAGNLNAIVAVNYATSDGTAVAGKDYTAASGTLTFPAASGTLPLPPGVTDQTFSITILPNSSQVASSVTVNLALSQPTGGSTLGSPSTATLTINNNLPPILQFSSSTYTTYTGSSSSIVTVTRGGGSHGSTVQVQYATAGGSAVAGVDYTPVSGTLTFLANQTTATFTVPILNGGATVTNTVGLVLSGPTGGGQLGPISTATLTIMAGSPYNPVGPTDPVPPQVTGEQLVLGPAGITAVLFSFSKPLNPSRVQDLGNYGYYVDVAGANGTFGTPNDIYIALSAAQYNSATSTITVIPSAPLPLNRFERITINGLANPLLGRGLISTSGVLLSGLSNGVPGSPFVATFGVGSSLAYTDSLGKSVQLSLTGGGLIEMFRAPVGNAQSVSLVGAVPHKSVLTHPGRPYYLHAPDPGCSRRAVPLQDASERLPLDSPAPGRKNSTRQAGRRSPAPGRKNSTRQAGRRQATEMKPDSPARRTAPLDGDQCRCDPHPVMTIAFPAHARLPWDLRRGQAGGDGPSRPREPVPPIRITGSRARQVSWWRGFAGRSRSWGSTAEARRLPSAWPRDWAWLRS